MDAFYCNKRGNIQEEGTAITERNTIIERGTFKLNYGRKKWNARENREERGREINICIYVENVMFIFIATTPIEKIIKSHSIIVYMENKSMSDFEWIDHTRRE